MNRTRRQAQEQTHIDIGEPTDQPASEPGGGCLLLNGRGADDLLALRTERRDEVLRVLAHRRDDLLQHVAVELVRIDAKHGLVVRVVRRGGPLLSDPAPRRRPAPRRACAWAWRLFLLRLRRRAWAGGRVGGGATTLAPGPTMAHFGQHQVLSTIWPGC